MCMHICACACLHVCLYVCVCACIQYVSVYNYMFACVYVCVFNVLCVCLHRCIGNYILAIQKHYSCPYVSINWFSFHTLTYGQHFTGVINLYLKE